jgi:hypothetical protein
MSNERKPHKHAEAIKAWADGKQIQFDDDDRGWVDVLSNRPFWSEQTAYRVKPEPVKVRYRDYIWKGSNGQYLVDTVNTSESFNTGIMEEQNNFVSWIHTEWQEVEVPQ